ncbi:hypothetical protein BG006_006581 [Podila minutissima]|uniref:Uncharacterized protein n=1 Tax=Podila minutissima TaxID=64525 RepID=A0A9P5VKY5_9FUNG|nr:hypothetical protein BG006_006581 [Podila minutissima]
MARRPSSLTRRGNPIDDEMVEFHADSVQGVFIHKEPVYDVALRRVHQNIAVTGGSDDKSYLMASLYEFGSHTDSVIQVAFSVDGKVRVWKSETGEFVCELEGPDEVVD